MAELILTYRYVILSERHTHSWGLIYEVFGIPDKDSIEGNSIKS